jgi:pilus assembly protein CpaE
VDDFGQAVEAARSRQPQVTLVEMTPDLRRLKLLVEELRAAAPETAVVAAFRPDALPPDVPESLVLIEALRLGVRDFVRRPVSSDELTGLLDRVAAPREELPSRRGKVITFISNKGGVGKSTLALNTACGLAQRLPGRVLLVDASLQMGVCAALLDIEPPATLTEAVRQRDRLDERLLRELAIVHSSGLHLLAAPHNAVEAAEVTEEAMTQVLALARRCYDFVVVDTFPLLDGVVMSILDQADRVYLVLENVVPTLLGGVKLLAVLDRLGLPRERLQIVLNRYTARGGNLRATDVADRLDRDVDFVVPHDRRIVMAANLGEPFLLRRALFSGAAREMRRLADDVSHLANGRAPSPKNGFVLPAASSAQGEAV